ncbi:MAG: hypothetical protein RL235_643, partial [Chlamydiota bacterium]
MPFFALDEDNQRIFAKQANPFAMFRCLECGQRVRVRQGKDRLPHFYHVRNAPSCRLYSRSEDHLLIQLQLARSLPKGEVKLEAPIDAARRIADVYWTTQNIVFEIQCSLIDLREIEARTRAYQENGYQIVWLLDDRPFNRRLVSREEKFLRTQACYYTAFQRSTPSLFYDQLEIIRINQRLKKGKRLSIEPGAPRKLS